ncbi:SET domain-containing protein-lysine N-methyltransferase [Patescibacteria group bacterium]|nr:MAG: SET domain-containing protein-lysine N-methyltransferase [Patescibacteria group bacterium]
MLLVKTKIGLSKLHGIGLFADQFIPKGTKIWEFTPGIDLKFGESELVSMPETIRNFIKGYSYQNNKTKKYILCVDNARFFNHSDQANTEDAENGTSEGATISSVDINLGEELTWNYRLGDASWTERKFLQEL